MKLKSLALVAALTFGSLGFADFANAKNLDTDTDNLTQKFIDEASEDLIPIEVKEIFTMMNSAEKTGNDADGYSSINDRNDGIGLFNHNMFHKYNSKNFSHSSGGASVIDVTQGDVGFWNSLYQNQYNGWGYTAYIVSNSYKPNYASAVVDVSSSGVNPNIAIRGSNWSLFTSTKRIASDSTDYKSKQFAQAYFDDVRIQNLSNFTYNFEVTSNLGFSNAGSSQTTTNVRFFQ